MHARGTIVGLTAGAGKNHIIRAALEAIALQSEDVISSMRADMKDFYGENASISHLKVDGGASANNLLMQMQSDFSGIIVERSSNAEATAAGAAYLAGLAVGFFDDREELRSKSGAGKVFKPQADTDKIKKKLDGWHRAIKACRVFSESEE
jgi:glycerol kinase